MSRENLNAGKQIVDDPRIEGPNPNSALIWYPAILAAGLPIPRTEFVEYDPNSLYPVLDGEPAGEFPWEELSEACRKIGFPCFLRTDLASAKHYGPKAFKVERDVDLWRHVFDTFEDNCLKDIAGQTKAFMVREWITIPPAFTAFGGLPIGTEWRFFANQSEVLCHHFYWPNDAFRRSSRCSEDDWQERLAMISQEPDPFTLAQLEELALRASRAIGRDTWSVDFAQDATERWWLIDMARAANSWHPETCQLAEM